MLNCTLHKKSLYLELFWSAFFPRFPTFGLDTKRYGVSIRIDYLSILGPNAGKMQTRTIPNMDTFYAVAFF